MAFLMMGEMGGGGDEKSRDPPLNRGRGVFRTCCSVLDKKRVGLEPGGESGYRRQSLLLDPP